MAGLPGGNDWPASIYQIEQTDPVVGGPPNEGTGAGLSNIPHWQLERRTNWLKPKVDALIEAVVAASTTIAGLVKLTDSTTSTSTTTAATPNAVKAANDNANTRARASRKVEVSGLLTGGGTLEADVEIGLPAATLAEAEAGESSTKVMTPVATRRAIVSSFSQNFNSNGSVVLPNGAIFQWGRVITDATGKGSVTFPLAFPTSAFQVIVGDWSDNLDLAGSHVNSVSAVTRTGFQVMSVRYDGLQGASAVPWFAIGR